MSLHYWLLASEALQVRAARELRGPIINARGSARAEPTLPLAVDAASGLAVIRVEGLLTPTPDPQSEWYGEANTTYPDLRAALATAAADKAVREIVWSIDSPGGAVDGLFALLDDIADARAAAGAKPMRVHAENAHSAAYGIAAAVGRITAASRMTSVGSVGVATSSFVLGDMIGRVVHMTNTDAPEKRPEIGTPEGRDVVVRYLDQIGAEFMGAIARGRGVALDTVAKSYGRGSSMLATAALAAGMIDGIAPRAAVKRPYVASLDGGRTFAYAPAGMAQTEPSPDAPAGDPPASDPPAGDPPADAPAGDPPAGDPPANAAPAENASALDLAAALVAISGLDLKASVDLFRSLVAADAERATAERKSLVGQLVALRAETPDTAYANGVLKPRLASEPIADLRARVAALSAQPGAASVPKPPPVGPDAENLTAAERKAADGIADPKARQRFIDHRQSLKGNR